MKKMSTLFLSFFSLIFISCWLNLEASSVHPPVIVLKNGTLIDGNGAKPFLNTTIIVQDKKILKITQERKKVFPPGSSVIDVKGMFILPGVINAHVHEGYNAKNLKTWALSGVTTVRDLNIRDETSPFTTRDLLMKTNRNARLLAAGPMVTAVNGYGSLYISSQKDVQEKIWHLIHSGADVIKIAIEDSIQMKTWPMLSLKEIEVIVDTAHEFDIPVSAHISLARHLKIALEQGVDDIAHMVIDKVPDKLIQRMVEEEIYWIPTLELWDGVSRIHPVDYISPAKENLSRFVQAGGMVALGTDYGGYIFEFESGMPLKEMRLMQEAGMTPDKIIVAATKHAAHVCRIEKEVGTIEQGKVADIIVVERNPLKNIEALSDVHLVMHNGEIIYRK